MKSILDPTFKYVSSVSTDIEKTFARVRAELEQQKAPPQDDDAGDDSDGGTHD